MKKIYLTLVIGLLLIGIISAGFTIQKVTSFRDSPKLENIMNYTLVWVETEHMAESCYVLPNDEKNIPSFESKIYDLDFIECGSEKGFEIIFNTVQEQQIRINNLETENAIIKSYLCIKDPLAPWCV